MKKNLILIACAGVCSFLVSLEGAARIPPGTTIQVRTIDRIESDSNREGQFFRASLAEPIILQGNTLAPTGADAQLRITEVRKSGKVRGNAELTVTLASVTVNGEVLNLNTENATTRGAGKGKGTAVKTGVGAGIGAALGAIFGGGKGAAIGAGAGAATGAGVSIVMSGPRVVIPSETRLSFTVR